ncbi:TPA: toxin [Klebsiella oxytoca]|nr:toxin [Klebsiella oxytoca]
MYDTASLLKKAAKGSENSQISLATLQSFSLAEIRKNFKSELSWGEAQHLYREAQEQLKKNRILESRIFTRANPQLPQAIRSGIRDNATSRSYDSMFGSRSSSFVKPGSVASMFSPAGYLTELYREARGLHAANTAYNLDVRRPDLAGLLLSQENMDEEISTLTLSNDIMLSHVEKQAGISGDKLLEHFSTDRFSAATPYHQPYETLRQSILTLDPELDALAAAPDVFSQADKGSLLSILANISPELHNILMEEVTTENADALYSDNFPEKIEIELFNSVSYIADYYGLAQDEVVKYINTLIVPSSPDTHIYPNIRSEEGQLYIDFVTIKTEIKVNNQKIYNEWDLVYKGGDQFSLSFNSKSDISSASIRQSPANTTTGSVVIGDISNVSKERNYQAKLDKTICNKEALKTGKRIFTYARNGSNTIDDGNSFYVEETPLAQVMLALNKTIRLCRATGITPEQLESLVYGAGTDGKINEYVISLLFHAIYFRQRYAIDLDKALVLASANISQFTGSAGVSQFDRLFNTPALAGEWFSADDSKISFEPGADDASFARDSLLRGLAVTSGELYQLALMSGLIEENKLKLTLGNISILYRLSLVAHLNGLTVNELYLLFTVSPFVDATRVAFVQYAYQLSHWMAEAGLSAAEVWMLTSSVHPATLTPEMLTLRNTIAVTDVEAKDDAARRRLIAPHIAGALGLSSPDMAASLVQWCENAGCFTLEAFLKLLLAETLKPVDEALLAGYLHMLAQYSLTVQALSLSEAEVGVLAGIPGARQLLPDVAQDNALARLMSLHYFHQWLNTLGRESSAILAALNEGKLTTTLMASAMGLDVAVLTQALSCVDEDASAEATLGNWQTIYKILQWVNVATALNTMPVVVKQLVDIRLSGKADQQPDWDAWKDLSRSLEAALTQRQAVALAASSAGRLSEVLCSWFLANVETDGVTLRSRDDLYSYFLIDNQVSSEVNTTRLAEAISGIQLYINRALNRIEPDVVADVSMRQFFIDWEMNSRYSTWGGVSRLAYYPENYVDPLQRIGQTKMMDELLQNINQGQLSEDTVEDAFKTYLARFETIADLKVISAYHDNVNSDTGKTWFIGRAREAVGEYYWRNVDMSRFSEGKLAANAWSEWVKIDAPINAWKNTVRPVIFRDRLYVVWIEQQEIAEGEINNLELAYRFLLKLAFLRHDGNWSSPWSFDITSQIIQILGPSMSDQNEGMLGLASSCFQGEDTLMILLYKIQDKYNFTRSASNELMRGMFIYADGSIKDSDDSSAKVINYFGAMANTLDITSDTPSGIIHRACYRFAVGYDVPTSLDMGSAVGDYQLTTLAGNRLNIDYSVSNSKLNIILSNPELSVSYYDSSPSMHRQIRAMKLLGVKGGATIGTIGSYTLLEGSDNHVAITAMKKGPTLTGMVGYAMQNRVSFSPSLSIKTRFGDFISTVGIGNEAGIVFYPLIFGYDTYLGQKGNSVLKNDYIWSRISVDSMIEVDFFLDADNITVTTKAGSETKIFKASNNVISLPDQDFDMVYNFSALEVSGETLEFVNNRAPLDITYEAKARDGRSLGKISKTLTINRSSYETAKILQLIETDAGVQYMQYGIFRIRLNTLLAPQLVSRANTGINAILSMETQLLPEPLLGEGFFADFTLPAYDSSTHGSSRVVKLRIANIDGSTSRRDYWSGMLADSQSIIRLFIPYRSGYYSNEGVSVSVVFSSKSYEGFWEPAFFYRRGDGKDDYVNGEYKPDDGYVAGQFVLINDKDYDKNWTLKGKIEVKKYKGFDNVQVSPAATAPLDFNSSSALYYWELFYYVPMMCFRRFLDENKFSEARAWLNYIWNPNGYIVNGAIAPWTWNCRPLEETTSWNGNPLDAIDPDAVAQNDPTHYKVATFMNFIKLLITRGDMCYRELTRDALAEAKMWYVQALNVLGDEPADYGTATWGMPSLASAASDTTRAAYQGLLAAIEPDTAFPDIQDKVDTATDEPSAPDDVTANVATTDISDTQTRTANSLTGLFLPEYNPALTEMWTTLRLRLYNLRHNLSIDGLPLSLSIYAEPADPAALLSSMVQASVGGAALPKGMLSLYRFPLMLERARNLVAQLTQFGSSLLSMAEHDDADAFSTLLMQQGMELMEHSIRLQQRSVDETEADIATLKVTLEGAQARLDKYTKLYDEDVSTGERQTMVLADTASALTLAGQAMGIIGGAADLAPNTFGMACGGSRWGALSTGMATGMGMQSASIQAAADKISRSEMYRRRREEWEIQRNNAQSEVDQIEAQLAGMAIRLEAANLQVDYLETQQGHTLAQLEFMQRKFTNQALYSWMRGKLSAIYYQFFDIAQSCCLMAQEALRRELNDNSLTFIRGSAWNGATAGFMAGETLLLNLAEMDKAWMERDERALEVTRTVSLAQVYAGLPGENNHFNFRDEVVAMVGAGSGSKGNDGNTLTFNSDKELAASVKLSGLNIKNDYKSSLGSTRRIKQVSVTLPALVGPYEDVRAVLSYGGSVVMPRGCSSIAVSHGMNDSGQFQLDFNDARYLPFEGIPVDDTGTLTLSFPDADSRQKALLESLNDIILHIRYTIQS